ncbi:hypothetical protein [Pelagibacterium lentulum]|uniref:Uncharacterized protein n=1 Tax=Pelagibacterium lentulum TaxID=2029865 RepID=A0A916RPX8_9HYPH|nr:hypothetical protein [Pelagibacterium lentulum]GGA64672.1 hypothetical protein GCM10011499_38930 [Pelagibacterium lentulum]
MTRPNDIMAAAERVYEKVGRGSIQDIDTIAGAIEAAVIAERERCATAAVQQTFDAHELAQTSDYGRGMDHAARTILTAIRGGSYA